MKLEVLKKSTVSVFQRTGNDETTYLNNLHPPEPEFQNGRNITFPPVTFMKYPSNLVTTSKYSIFTWAPKSLIWQFRRVSNVYFLIISILSAMPFSPKNPFSVGGTFAAVLLFTMLKEGYEDYYRHKQDTQINSVICNKLDIESKTLEKIHAKDAKVGDILLVNNGDCFPADLLFLSSSDGKGIAYVNTANLDGESNLKEKLAVDQTKGIASTAMLSDLRLFVECDKPNSNFTWSCNVQVFNQEKNPAGLKQLLLKGCHLENTRFVYGLVVYTGVDTKIIQNSKEPPSKVSNVLKKMNKILYTVFLLQISVCLLFSGFSTSLNPDLQKHSYLDLPSSGSALGFLLQTLTYWVAYSHLIPISLYVALEVLKLFLAFLIEQDLEMYCNGSRAKCKSSDLVEELGQVEFVFSDKTGTLTSNEMVFRKCLVNGVVYGKIDEEFGRAGGYESAVVSNSSHDEYHKLRHFLKFMAVCNSVFPSSDNEKSLVYQSSSPDELALVQCSRGLGVTLADRSDNSAHLDVGGKTESWEIMVEIPFSSDRKRMSVIARHPNSKKIVVMTKGADVVMIPRLAKQPLEKLHAALHAFSIEGLRTLVMAQRLVGGKEYHEWHGRWKNTMLANEPNKELLLDELASEIEHSLELVGCSGVEDKLQEGVPATIELLLATGIRLWVLTGDKEETAIEIAKTCNLIRRDMEVVLLSSHDHTEVHEKLLERDKAYSLHSSSFSALETRRQWLDNDLSIVVDGFTLAFILCDPLLKELFFKLGFLSTSCVCCRVSPLQKMEVVQLAKFYGSWITVSIGDGANDVSMIQEAHIGIGISGKEGTQASQAADFVLNQFRFLGKLLLVHGRWGYRRVSWFICYYFYKNVAVVFTEIWFAIYNGYSGQIFFLDWLPLLYNSFWTSWPCLVAYGLEQDVDAGSSMRFSELYRIGQRGGYFSIGKFWNWMCFAVWHGTFCFYVTVNCTSIAVDAEGRMRDMWWVSSVAFSIILNVVTLKLYIENLYWTWVSM